MKARVAGPLPGGSAPVNPRFHIGNARAAARVLDSGPCASRLPARRRCSGGDDESWAVKKSSTVTNVPEAVIGSADCNRLDQARSINPECVKTLSFQATLADQNGRLMGDHGAIGDTFGREPRAG